MVNLRNVTKRYGGTVAVYNLSMEIPSGQIIGLLGENGAGKTTLMHMMAGYLPAGNGDIVINGCDMLLDPISARGALGYMPEQVPLYPELTVLEYLAFCCAIKRVDPGKRIAHCSDIAAMAGLGNALNKRIGTLSKGLRQRVGFAQALCGSPPLLLLDEPTAGFDPAQAAEFRGQVRSLAKQHTVVVSSHILSEIDIMCDRVVIMKDGRLVHDQTLHQDHPESASTIRLVIGGSNGAFLPTLRALPSVVKITPSDNAELDRIAVLATVKNLEQFGRELAALVSGLGLSLFSLRPVERTLEDIFLTFSRADHSPTGAQRQ